MIYTMKHVSVFYVAQNCPIRNGHLLCKVFTCGISDYLHTQDYISVVRYNYYINQKYGMPN